jgi:uncharacterized membrane protein
MRREIDHSWYSPNRLILKGLTWLVYALAVWFVVTACLTLAVVVNALASVGFFGFLAYWKTCIILFSAYALLLFGGVRETSAACSERDEGSETHMLEENHGHCQTFDGDRRVLIARRGRATNRRPA